MQLRRYKRELIYLTVFIVVIFTGAYRLPAYASRLPWLMLLAFTDLYLAHKIRSYGSSLNQKLRWLAKLVLWAPSFLLIVFLGSMLFVSPLGWYPVIRTYLLGIVVLLILIRAFPLLALILNDLSRMLSGRNVTKFSGNLFRKAFRGSVFLSMLLALVFISGMTLRVYDFEVSEVQIHTTSLPEVFEGYRIVQISDLHLGRWHSSEPLARAVELINSLEPDMVVFTGDLVNYSTEEALPYESILSKIEANDGIYAVLGNHDYGDYLRWSEPNGQGNNIRQMFELLNRMGWVLLENSHHKIDRDGFCINIAGIGHYSTKFYIPDRADILRALDGIDDVCYTILLSHTPSIIQHEMMDISAVDLIFSGHTHAMQVGIRIGSEKYSPAALAYRYWGGLYQTEIAAEGKTNLYVNRGLGHIAFPARIGLKPEISLIILTKQ